MIDNILRFKIIDILLYQFQISIFLNTIKKTKKKGTVKFDDDKSEISGTKWNTELNSLNDRQNDLDNILTEVEKRKTLARHTKEELQKESADQMAFTQNRKQNSIRSKNQLQQY